MNDGWTVFNNATSTAATTGTWIMSPITNLGSTVYEQIVREKAPEPEGYPDDPLAWLSARVGEVCELGYL